ncbi:MAG TPA: lysoplasmalogenase family protein, partial [Candidatus Lokiarchaeia archaeon]|nr:lysoplasmalogenase family protein [Candidatus Lokiarchaeia archaeon]
MWPKNQACFIVGLLAFLVGHVLYIVAFLMASSYFTSVPPLLYAALVGYAVFFAGTFRFFLPYLKDMKVPLAVYFSLLLAMSFTALAVAVSL